MNSGKAARSAVRSGRRSSVRQRRRLQDRIADQITAFAGSMAFVYLHVAWFAVWIVINVTGWRFDPFPFGLLTLIVSLEAIFLSTFVMISQNRESARSDLRARQDFETNALSEAWLEALGDKLGVDVAAVHTAAKKRIRQAKAQADKLDRDGSHPR
ncbi:MAG TPA: DUF1003 domain-containing protein [Trebonia sp.]|jgi:uncharacterized membrane protein|nr:DUF1003 domain-containing protein [Trebonia sp.]